MSTPTATPLSGLVSPLIARTPAPRRQRSRARPERRPRRRRGSRAAASPNPPPPLVRTTKRSPAASAMPTALGGKASTAPSPRRTSQPPAAPERPPSRPGGGHGDAIAPHRDRRGALDQHDDLDAEAAPPPACAPGVLDQRHAFDHERELRFERFHLRQPGPPAQVKAPVASGPSSPRGAQATEVEPHVQPRLAACPSWPGPPPGPPAPLARDPDDTPASDHRCTIRSRPQPVPGARLDSASTIASITAVTTTIRPPHAAGRAGFTRLPSGNLRVTGAKQPSFMGRSGSRKQRRAKITPEVVCENDELIDPRACGPVSLRSTTIPPRSPGAPAPPVPLVPPTTNAPARRAYDRPRRRRRR